MCELEKEHNLRTTGSPYAWCIDCMKEYKKNYYQENKESFRIRQRKTDCKRREKARELIRTEKSKPCTDCGKQYPYYVMQFDHISDDKEYVISRMLTKSLHLIKKEIEKCEVVCANCHAVRTFERINQE